MVAPIRAGLLGTGHGHAAGKLNVMEQSDDYEVVGVAEPDAGWRAIREQEPAYADARWMDAADLLGDPSVQLIAVESDVPPNLALARRAIEAGKHVHLDKPPGTSLPELQSILAEANRRGLFVQMGYMFRYNAGFELVFRAAREGWLGDVYYVHASMCSNIPFEPAEAVAPGMPLRGRAGLAFHPGGMMLELGCHIMDRVVELLGRPNKVTPFLRHDSEYDDTLADNTVAIFEYERAVAVVETAAMEVQPMVRRQFEVVGTKGSIVLQPLEPPAIRLCLQEPRGGYRAGWQDVEVAHIPRYERDLAKLARVIRGEEPIDYTTEHDLVTQETVLRACGTPP